MIFMELCLKIFSSFFELLKKILMWDFLWEGKYYGVLCKVFDIRSSVFDIHYSKKYQILNEPTLKSIETLILRIMLIVFIRVINL